MTSTTAPPRTSVPSSLATPTQHQFPRHTEPQSDRGIYTAAEVEAICASAPLLYQYARVGTALDGWALIFRDHYVENSLAFLTASRRAGIPAQWTFALSKGDQTSSRNIVHHSLLDAGFRSALLDNAALDGLPSPQSPEEAGAVLSDIDAFIDQAHDAGRRVLVIDDGGLLARGYGSTKRRHVDAAIELTVSGIKRIAAAEVDIPVFNMARSELKTHLGYLEIADSCMRRLHSILPSHKLIGRQVLLLGYGTLGSRLAAIMRATGCTVSVVDTDILTLIAAAEAGYPTYRSAADALAAMQPFLIVGTTGDQALKIADIELLHDGAFLAPFATKDFSVLADPDGSWQRTSVPGVGTRIRLADHRHIVLLGDGRSLNLYGADAIPNQGYDAYRAGTMIAAKALCADPTRYPAGLSTAGADQAITNSGLYDAYYDRYLAAVPARVTPTSLLRACVVGYGVAGRLHAQILAAASADVIAVDPQPGKPAEHGPTVVPSIDDLPDDQAGVDLWSVCSPTDEHLPVLRSILGRNPAARILLEKPACASHEIDELADLLSRHPHARVVVNDQYQHATALSALSELIARIEPDEPVHQIAIAFTKDRSADIATGRFIDRNYGVLGYEWLHMLAVLRRLLSAGQFDEYLRAEPSASELWATYDPRLFVGALTERTSLRSPDGQRVHIEMISSILGPLVAVGPPPDERTRWRRQRRNDDDRHRHVAVHAGKTRFTVHLDPVTAPGGWQLNRNEHRLTAERDGIVLHDEVIEDSPLGTALTTAVATLLSDTDVPSPDLSGLRRISALAAVLHAQRPEHQATPVVAVPV